MIPQLAVSKELLLTVRKPARYIGGEIGCANKDFSAAEVKVCLAFPDVYDVGMSHLGLRILYDVINRSPEYAADRVFSPWMDMEEALKARGIPLFGLESQRPVKEFDILGFSIPYELTYTNVLNILSLSGIPLRSDERDERWPLVIAGGTSCLNPEPLADFVDLFLIGDAEEAITDILKVYRGCRQRGCDRKETLRKLSHIPGVYVPSFYEGVGQDGELKVVAKGAPRKILKRTVRDLERLMDFSSWVIPYIEIVHDRISLEIMRGCPHGCRFCQAYAAFYPLRVIRKEKVLSLARRLYRMTGYEEISLLSLSSSDHPQLKEIVLGLVDEFREHGVGISLPSIRATSLVGELSHVFSTMRKTTLTFAPEAGSQRLRDLLGKTLDVRDIFDAARQAYTAGYRSLKLYFMIGLPTETEEDLKEIVAFCTSLAFLKKEVDGHPARLNVTISNFVPKPHTPFERAGMCPVELLEAKQEFLRNAFKSKRGLIQLKFHDAQMSRLEAFLARGGRECGRVVAAAQAAGARFDAWNDQFQPGVWKDVWARQEVDLAALTGPREGADALPWAFVETGVRIRAI
ncbi:MAG: TIGR03960 family B12-binding radical SAM protein [Candidatus Omnitrophica bacterium]|nr:TIGR03960 family B12-binding radical SAM protein [Candidatus Omnitrophota bacterium]MDD5573775.1 TIGR03960 family B12-binding radical SAM protein [Candidatus Omnitrophota bacterium]